MKAADIVITLMKISIEYGRYAFIKEWDIR